MNVNVMGFVTSVKYMDDCCAVRVMKEQLALNSLNNIHTQSLLSQMLIVFQDGNEICWH